MRHDLVLVGGGLANSLIAWRLRQLDPRLDLVVVEREARLGGNHTWSFHAGDITPRQHEWMAPLVEHTWPHYEVRFPAHSRRLEDGYHSLSSERLHEVVTPVLEGRLRLGCEVAGVAPDHVRLASGERIEARTVVDGRGDSRSRHLVLRYQKFIGQVVELEREHGLDGPVMMDATVEQREGYRFLYTLPYGPRTALIEDTRYSDTPGLDEAELRAEIASYAAARGWGIARVAREERGILPITLSGDIEAFWDEGPADVPRSGLRAALFHPTTGYSLPEAVRLADKLAGAPLPDSADLYREIRAHSARIWRQQGFFRMLNRMLFIAGAPADRYRVLQRFYRLPAPLVRRFYAGQLTLGDRVRVLSGKPPVPIGRALRSLFETGANTPAASGQGGRA